MTLYIYRVGWTYPARNPITDLNLLRVLVVLGFQVDRSDRSDPPVSVARPATWSRPVRPLSSTGQTGLFDQCQFWSSTYAPLFFGNASMPKNKPLDQNCLKTMINMHRPYFVPQRSRQNMLTPFTGQHTIALGCATRGGAPCSTSCVERSDRSDRSPCTTATIRRTLAQEGPSRGKRA